MDVKCIAESGLKSPGALESEQQFIRGWRGEGMMNAGGARVLVYFADGDGGGSGGRGAVGGGLSGTVRLTVRRRLHRINFRDSSKYRESGTTHRVGGPGFRLPLLSLPKRLLLSEAPSATLPARLRVGDMTPVR